MCGITGIVDKRRRPIDIGLLIRMARSMVHRGPDEEGYFVNAGRLRSLEAGKLETPLRGGIEGGAGNVGLGHRRLSIIDLASGQQPLCNEDGTAWITFNGEVYNFQDLKKELEAKGHRFKTNSDTEAILHAYEEWGKQAPGKLRGMFAFAIWDERRQELFLARDRLGKKPIYYFYDENRFIFASEIKAILETPGIDREIDFSALSDYLSLMYIPSPKTIFTRIKKLPAASYAVLTADTLKVGEYWDIDFFPDETISEKKAMDDLLGILQEATRIRMISEVPLGAFLSGGVDSSAVVAMMARASSERVLTNSISFNEERYNEAPYALEVASLFNTDHHEFNVTPETLKIIEKLAWHYDEPFADSSAIPTYYVSEMARQNVTVSLSGDGGDENFAGYTRYVFDARENRFRGYLPVAIQRSVFNFLSGLYPRSDSLSKVFKGKAFVANLARNPVNAYFFNVSSFHDEVKKELLNPDVCKTIDGYRTLDYFKGLYGKAPARDHLSRIQYLDIKSYLCEDILTKVDRASMAVSLEVRCPLLDHVFMEYAARIPSALKISGKDGKLIFKKALERYLPKNLLYRDKMGFALPVSEWLKGEVKAYARKLIFEGDASRMFLNRAFLTGIWEDHQSGLKDRSFPLWSIMMLNLWYEKFGA